MTRSVCCVRAARLPRLSLSDLHGDARASVLASSIAGDLPQKAFVSGKKSTLIKDGGCRPWCEIRNVGNAVSETVPLLDEVEMISNGVRGTCKRCICIQSSSESVNCTTFHYQHRKRQLFHQAHHINTSQFTRRL